MSAALRHWLEALGLAQYAERFAADDIDIDVLPSLSEQDLAELGVSMGHRKRLLKAIAELTSPARAPSPAPATAVAAASAPTQPTTGTADARKVVTIVFADLIGSTSLHEQLDAESVTRLMERYYATMRTAVAEHGGTVVKLLGDGVMAAFGVPRVAEDDAIRAVRAGVAMQEAFRDFARRELAAVADVGLRVGINTGEVVVAADDTDVVGDPVNVAARLQAEAGDGDVLIGEATRRLVSSLVSLTPLGRVALKGRAESVKAYRVDSLERPVGVAAAAFVGRDDELARLTAVYDAACTAPAARLAVLLGSPGLGKSRLIEEVGRRLGDAASVVTAHCDAAGGATFAPVAAALREHLQIEAGASTGAVQQVIAAAIPEGDAERDRIAAGIAALLADSPGSPEETFFVIRRFLAGLAAAKPVLLVIDDLHWAEPLLLDLVEHLVQWGSGTPLMVLVGARPELRDLRSSLVTPGGLVSDVLTLGGLDAGAAMRLAASVIGAADLPAAVAAKVLATSEGNPLFVGELVRMLVDEGAIERQGERWVVGANLAAFEMPPTIHALLAARIERLGPDDRAVLERAAVVGRHFSRSAVAALLGRNGNELNARLEALRRTELIERDTGWFLGEPVLRFHHVLIRDAAYRRLLKGTRAALHEQLADWIEAQVGDAAEHDETIGWHLEQAHQHRRELGPLDASGRALGERAARRLAAAGRRALARDDAPVAAGLLGRALERLAEDDATRAELALDWCEALLASGDVTTAERAIAELGRFVGDPEASGQPRLAAWHTCFRGQLTVLTAPQALHDTADAVAAAATELATLGDAAGEAKGHFVHALALSRLGRVGACEAALDKALAAARRADDRRRANTVLAIAPLAALWGPSPVTRASGRCLDVVRVLRITQGAPAVEAVALSCQAVLEALRGRADAARRMIAAARKMVEDLGITQRLLEADAFGGLIDLLEGDAPAAERALRAAYQGLRELGLGIDAARAAALLARALLAQDRGADAEALSHESEALAGDDLKAAIAWRGVRAEALARRGAHATAVELAQAAVGIAAATDALLDHADARLALAAALRAAGRGRDADAEERRAIELWEAKGAVLLVERTRRTKAQVAVTASAPEPRTAPAPAPPGPAPATRRRVTPNRATAALIPFNAAMAARDLDAFREQLSESYEEIDHPTGASFGRDANVASLERLLRSRDARCHVEPLATLGDALVLTRRTIHASATGGGRFDVGAYEQEAYTIAELDESGRWCRHEVFAADRLHDARVRLFARHAELLPAGPERTGAVATARSLEIFRRAEADPDSLVEALAPDLEGVDHRHLSSHSVHGAAAYIDHLRGWRQVADDLVFRERDILALVPRAMLVATLHTGNARNGGGAYERSFLTLFVLDESGRIARAEWFDDDRADDALARFDALTGDAAPRRPARRRVRANAATRDLERQWTAIEARDVEAITALNAQVKVIHHPTGATYGAPEIVSLFRDLWRGTNLRASQEILATLGDSLVLLRRSASHDGVDARFGSVGPVSVGPVEVEYVQVFEVDEQGRAKHSEVFAAERLGDAVARLYERHAELLPEGREKVRAAATAASFVVVKDALFDPKRFMRALAPDFESIDHRLLSSWSLRGADAYLAHLRALHEVADDIEFRQLDVIALSPSAQLVRVLHTGTDRAGGGRYERPFLRLAVADTAGRLARAEWFDDDREAEALARFDEIVASGAIGAPQSAARRRGTPNAATANAERFGAAVAARDLDALADVLCDEIETLHHQTGVEYGRRGFLATWRSMFRAAEMTRRQETIASLGDTLALAHHTIRLEGFTEEHIAAIGAVDIDEVVLFEVDDSGRTCRFDIFPVEKLGDALVRLYERHAELLPAGPESERAAATARSVAAWNGPLDIVRVAAVTGPLVELVDHRSLHLWSAHGADEYLEQWRGHFALTDTSVRTDGVLALERHALLVRRTYFGTAREGGGEFVTPVLELWIYGVDGRSARVELWEPDAEAEALARFDELAAGSAPRPAVRRRVTPNAGSASMERVLRALAARDVEAFAAEVGPDFVEINHPTGATFGRAELLRSIEVFLGMPGAIVRQELLATLGERLWLVRRWMSARAATDPTLDVGAFETEEIGLHEVDERGLALRNETFAADRLGDALVRLYERHAELLPEGAEKTRVAAIARSLAAFDGRLDLDRIRAAYDPSSFRNVDHRVFGTWSVDSAEEMLRHFRLQLDLAPDFSGRYADVLAADAQGMVARMTFFGTARDSGGRFENHLAVLQVWGADGCIIRSELFEAEQVAEALARFDELSGPDRVELGPFENVASRAWREVITAWRGRDLERFAALQPGPLRYRDHRRLFQLDLDREGFLEFARPLLTMQAGRASLDLVGTRGERLALMRFTLEMEDDAVGPSAIDSLLLIETDEHRTIVAYDRWDLDDRDSALAALDARWAATEDGEFGRSWREANLALHRRDWDAFETVAVPEAEIHNHRLAGFGVASRSMMTRAAQEMFELAPDARLSALHVRSCRRGIMSYLVWSGTRDGGAFESPFVAVAEFDSGGRTVRVDFYDPHHVHRAQARYEEFRARSVEADGHGAGTAAFANAVTRMAERFVGVTDARDWTRLADLFAPDLRFDDRRPLLRMELPKEGFLVQFRVLFDVPNAHWTATTLATRGDRLALFRLTLLGDVADDGGPLEIEHLWIGGVDDDGRCDTIVLFEPDDLDAAYDELDARYVAREGARHPHVMPVVMGWRRPFLDRDWDAFFAALAPDVVCHDHRLLGWGTVHGVAHWMRTQQVLVELAPDTGAREKHVALAERGALRSVLISGTRDGGPFELAFLRVDEIDASGRVCRIDLFDADEVDLALARFAELSSPARTSAIARFENAASLAFRAVIDADHAGLHAALDSLHQRFLRYRDHRRFVQLDLDQAGLRDFMTALPAMRAKHGSFDLVATRGDRLALTHHSLAMDDDTVGPSVIESLWLVETDEDGNIVAYDRWDPDELDAARAELDARYEAGDATPHRPCRDVMRDFVRAIAQRDFAAVAALCAESMVEYDHRSLAVLGTTRGGDAWARNFSVLADLSADTAYRVDHFRTAARGFLALGAWHGTRAGGPYEIPLHAVIELDERGRIVRADIHDDDGIDRALARFAELAAPGDRPSPPLAEPTSATIAFDRLMRHFDAHGDLDTVRAGCSRGFVWEDRRPIVGMSGDVELMIASARERVASGAQHERREIIGTAGDRIAIARILWAGGPADGRFEVEFLAVFEIDADGLCSALIFFEPDDLRAAQREAWARWAAIDPTVAEMTKYAGAIVDAWNAQDPDRMRALLSEDLVAADHRRTGIGPSEGREAYLRSVVALWELAPDSHLEAGLVWLAHAPHAGLYLCRRQGVLPDGGEFVSEFLALAVVERGLTAHLEVFEPDAADAALARFTELCSDPLRIPPNAVTRTWDRWCAAIDAGDWDTIAALYHPSYRSEDRRPLIRLTTDRAGMLENDRVLADGGWRPTRTLLATAGDRLALQHILWRTGEAGSDSEIEILQLTEVDDAGRFASSATFAPGDRAAAFRELASRQLALTRPSAIPRHQERLDAGRDLARLRAALPDDFFFHDHRRTGLGRLDGADAYVRSVAALHELAPDALVGLPLYFLADEPHGTLSIAHSFGTLADGGAFESVYAMIMLYGPDGMTGVELFELDDLDTAKARFAELRATTEC